MRIARVSWGLLLIGWISSAALGSSVTVTGTGMNGTTSVSASATFSVVTVSGTQYLQIQLSNVSSAIDNPVSVLTGVFFNYNHGGAGTLLSTTDPTKTFATYNLDPTGIAPSVGASVWYDKTGNWAQFTTGDINTSGGYHDSGSSFSYGSGNMGGEWGFASSTSNLANTVDHFGIGASGLGDFSPTSRFDESENLSPPPNGSLAGVNWGILGAVPHTGTAVPSPLTGTEQTPLAATGAMFRLQIATGANFDINQIDDVRFQYGTSTSELSFGGNNVPSINGVPLPATGSMGIGLLIALGAGALAHRRRYHAMP